VSITMRLPFALALVLYQAIPGLIPVTLAKLPPSAMLDFLRQWSTVSILLSISVSIVLHLTQDWSFPRVIDIADSVNYSRLAPDVVGRVDSAFNFPRAMTGGLNFMIYLVTNTFVGN
jgi:hypothetical protein